MFVRMSSPGDPLGVSAMRETGNILASAFLSAIGQLAGRAAIDSPRWFP